jgi:cobalt-zinc-cadmium efflux system membrane fusion protein
MAPLLEQDVSEQLVVTASIGANQDRFAHIAPRVAGRVIKVTGNLGDRAAGQTLAVIDSVDVGEAQSAYAQAASEHALAKAAAERADKLFADQIIPQKDYLRAKGDLDKATAVLRAAADRRQASASPDHRPRLQVRSSLRSPPHSRARWLKEGRAR